MQLMWSGDPRLDAFHRRLLWQTLRIRVALSIFIEVAGHNPLGSGWSLVSPFMPFLQQVSGVLHAAVSVMQKAIGIMVLADPGWADELRILT